MISDEADPVTAYLKAHFRPDVASNLLAAAQPLMAIAWDEGAMADHDFDSEVTTPNPYRSQA